MDIFETSYLRANIIAWLPVRKKDRVLYIGDAEDVAAKRLAELSEAVECVCAEHYYAEYKDTQNQEKWDYIICLGALCTRGAQEMLASFAELLRESGKLILAAENIFGLKYFAGAKEEGSKTYFGALEGRDDAAGFAKEELGRLLSDAGFSENTWYYPFPDYRFAMSIYSDEYLPKQGELIDQIGNFDEERLILFDETKAADTMIAQGKFREFSNSYLVVAGKPGGGAFLNAAGESVSFVKFSNDRGLSHNIRTCITKSADGARHLLKLADSEASREQITNMEKTYQALQRLYQGTRFTVNRYQEREDGAGFEFLQGRTMEEQLDFLLAQGELAQAKELMLEVFDEIRKCGEQQEFVPTEAFERVFGRADLPEGLAAVPVADIDMIMPNILLSEGSREWTVIDYEWSFHFPVPVNFILYRGIRYYAETTAKRRVLDAVDLYRCTGITEQELLAYAGMEEEFQRYVLNGHVPMRQLYREAGRPAYHITSLLHIRDEIERKRMLQVYFDRGSGTREEDCINFHSRSLDGEFHLEIPVDEDVIAVRIDPAGQACTASIERLCFSSSKEKIVEFYGPVHRVGGKIYLFESEDPYLLITDLPQGERRLFVDMRVETMSLSAAELIAPKIDTKYRIKKMLKK